MLELHNDNRASATPYDEIQSTADKQLVPPSHPHFFFRFATMQASRFHALTKAGRIAGPHHLQSSVIVTSSHCTSRIPTAAISTFARGMVSPRTTNNNPFNRITQLNKHITIFPKHSATMSSQTNNDQFQISNLFDVKGKVALVTGGGSGIGLMITQALAVNGAKVYITGRTQEKLDRVVESHGKDITGEIVALTADVSDKDSIKSLFEKFSKSEEHLDILVNNAGIATGSTNTEAGSAQKLKEALFENESATFADWDDIYRTNVSSIFFMTTAFLPLLDAGSNKTKGWSSAVLNITSISGSVKTSQHHPNYNASKAAAIHLNRMLANEIQENGLKIRVNGLAPGVFPSEMTTEESDENQKSAIPKEKFEGKVPAQRPGNDRDMANAALFAITNQYLNGQNFAVDGGYTLAAGL
jgi:NAD(P)-dependent dehydrogenase (short-subunit alcohol dehydrogenase family)